ncbi:MAG: hypothetical protein AAF578_14800 [Pseudomonadota bacterium]
MPIPVGDNSIKANYSEDTICIEVADDDFKILDYPHACLSKNLNYEGAKNTYTGTDRGEFGGGLEVTFPDGKSKSLIDDNVQALFRIDESLYVFTGLAHMNSDDGAIYRIDEYDSLEPQVSRITLLPSAPSVVILRERRRGYHFFTIICTSAILNFHFERERLSLVTGSRFWSGLYPNSAGAIGNEILIGARSGVFLVQESLETAKSIRFFTRDQSLIND